MVSDYDLEFASAQAIRNTGAATTYIPLGPSGSANGAGVGGINAADIAKGEDIDVVVHVDEAYATTTDITVDIQGCDDNAGTNPVSIMSRKYLLAEVNAVGFAKGFTLPGGVKKKWLRAYLTFQAASATGKMTIGLAPMRSSEKPNNDLISS